MEPDLAPVDVERRYQATFVGLVVVVLGVCAAWWLASDDEESVSAGGNVAVAAPANLDSTSLAQADALPASDAADARVAGGDDEIQLCGGHWVKAGPDGKPSADAFDAAVAMALDDVARNALGLMAASPVPRVQAAAHYYQAAHTAPPSASTSRRADAAAHREALARLAQVTDDPQVYAWAYRSCRGVGTEAAGSCMQITAAQWARMDPENAEPWLAAADEGRKRKDDAAVDDAMFHVAAAERHQSGWAVLASTVAEYAPQDEPSLVGSYATIVQALGIESLDATEWAGTAEYCSVKAIADPNRRETCERVATVLVERSTTVIARTIGIGIGRRLGWNDERLDALTSQQDAEARAAVLREGDPAQADIASCTPLRSGIERIRGDAEFGELEMLRRDVAATGLPVTRLAAEGRRQREQEARRADQAASAASAAPAASSAAVAQR